MISVADFQARFPEFAEVSDDRIQMFLDDAALIMGSREGRWLGFYDVAKAYYAAHLLVIAEATEAGDSGSIAPTKHQEVDDVVIKNAIGDVSPSAEDMYSTSYGKRYISYRRKCFAGIYGV